MARRDHSPPNGRAPLPWAVADCGAIGDRTRREVYDRHIGPRPRLQASELLALVQTQGFSVVCFADLPPSPSSKTRYLVKRLRAALPELRILVGRWGPPALADESTQVLRDTGANLVASTLLETRTYLAGLVEIPRIPVPETHVAHAA